MKALLSKPKFGSGREFTDLSDMHKTELMYELWLREIKPDEIEAMYDQFSHWHSHNHVLIQQTGDTALLGVKE